MIVLPEIDPVLLRIGPIAIRWYGLTYIIGFAVALILGTIRARRSHSPVTPAQFQDLVLYVLAGLVIGARIGYMVFYDLSALIAHPLSIVKIWQGGMSFHGGLLGVTIAILVFAHIHHLRFFDLADFATPLSPPGLFAGRIGNFINGELLGRPSDVPWAMVFSSPAADSVLRHPSQLYEAFLEGVVLFVILWLFSRQPRPRGSVLGLFLLLYGCFRFFVEFFRQPDSQLGFVALNFLTMGQVLCLFMIIIGGYLLLRKTGKNILS
ncbi:MAG: prolipoprotein diacylglyceryl transferase [Desulfobacteraceae bacterium]|nr:prolipoprotein diacylglyceryl transferase [Desulfobacteraceae bacterium]